MCVSVVYRFRSTARSIRGGDMASLLPHNEPLIQPIAPDGWGALHARDKDVVPASEQMTGRLAVRLS